MRKQAENRILFWIYLAPALIAFTLTVVIPFLIGFYYSLTDWNAISSAFSFLGFDNFIRAFTDEGLRNSFFHSIQYTILSVILINAVGLSLAILVSKPFKGSNLLRGAFFVPNMIGGLILGFLWQYVFVKAFPAIADIFFLGFLGVDWIGDKQYALFALVIVSTWQFAGYAMVIYIAALQSIPKSMIEAADMEGASGLNKFVYITLPMIVPAFTINIFLTLTNAFKQFDTNLSLTNGGPHKSTELLALHIYNEAFGYNDFGYGQAQAVLFFILISIVAIIQVRLTKKREVEL